MKMKSYSKALFFLIFVVIFLVNNLSAQVSLTVEFDSTEVFVGSPFKISFVLKNADVKSIKLPKFDSEGFSVFNGPINESRFTRVDSITSNIESYIFMLIPKNSGKITLGSATIITTTGDSLTTAPIDIFVKTASEKPEVKSEGEWMPENQEALKKMFFF
jgi:hypothetical protein